MEAIYIIAAVALTYAAYRAFRGGLRDLHGSKIPRGLVKMALTAGLFAGALEVGGYVGVSFEIDAKLLASYFLNSAIVFCCAVMVLRKALGETPLVSRLEKAAEVLVAIGFVAGVFVFYGLFKVLFGAALLVGFFYLLAKVGAKGDEELASDMVDGTRTMDATNLYAGSFHGDDEF